jgi:hypothetical protein
VAEKILVVRMKNPSEIIIVCQSTAMDYIDATHPIGVGEPPVAQYDDLNTRRNFQMRQKGEARPDCPVSFPSY